MTDYAVWYMMIYESNLEIRYPEHIETQRIDANMQTRIPNRTSKPRNHETPKRIAKAPNDANSAH